MKKKITMLENAEINKVDLVPAGAQQLSKIELMKSKEGKTVAEVNKQDLTPEELAEVQSLISQLKDKLGIVDEAKAETPEEPKENKTEEKEDNKDTEKECGDTEKACTGPETAAEQTTEKADEPKKEEADAENEVAKAALKKAADLEAQNNQLKEEIAKMNNEKIEKSFIAKASELKNIPGMETSELGKVLKSVYENCGVDTYNTLEAVLKSANELIGHGSMFVEKGTSSDIAGEPTTADEAYKQLEMLASNRITKGLSGTNNAMADAMKTPEGARLYSLYKSLQGGK